MPQLIRIQWDAYGRYHQARRNLVLHAIAVPVFLLSNVALVVAAVRGSRIGVVVALVAMVASISAQGRGHRWEPLAPEPFRSPSDALARIFCEQWITFPRFVATGHFADAIRGGN